MKIQIEKNIKRINELKIKYEKDVKIIREDCNKNKEYYNNQINIYIQNKSEFERKSIIESLSKKSVGNLKFVLINLIMYN